MDTDLLFKVVLALATGLAVLSMWQSVQVAQQMKQMHDIGALPYASQSSYAIQLLIQIGAIVVLGGIVFYLAARVQKLQSAFGGQFGGMFR